MESYRYALAITSQFYFCGIPFRLDTSPKCSLDCLYCFAMARGGRRTSTNLLANPSFFSKKFDRVFTKENENLDVTGELLKNRMPVHFGGMSDPFSNQANVKITKELLKILNDYQYPIVLSTKNTNELGKDNVIQILKEIKHLAIQITIPFANEKFAQTFEPFIPATQDRINCIRKLSQEGLHIIVRLQPLLPGLENETIHDLIPKLGAAGAKHVIVEYLKLPIESNLSLLDELSQKSGWQLVELYKNLRCIRTGREWVLPQLYKWEKLQPVIKAINDAGMTYGAADYGLNHLGDTDCCCGIDKISGFENWFKGNIPYLLRKVTKDYLSVDDWLTCYYPSHSIKMYMNSHCREDNVSTIHGFIKSKWNRPGTENSPNTFLGIAWDGDYDSAGNCIYHRKNSF